MFTPLPEMYVGSGIISSTEIFDTPPGVLDFQDSRPVFIRENEKYVRLKKKIVFSDDLLYVLNPRLYTDYYQDIYSIHEEIQQVVDLLYTSKPRTSVFEYNANGLQPEDFDDPVSFNLPEDLPMLRYYSLSLRVMLKELLKHGFEIYFYIDTTLLRFDESHMAFLDSFLHASQFTSNAYIYNLFSKDNIPADHVYIMDLPKVIQVIGNYQSPCITTPIKNVLELLQDNHVLHSAANSIKIEAVSATDAMLASSFEDVHSLDVDTDGDDNELTFIEDSEELLELLKNSQGDDYLDSKHLRILGGSLYFDDICTIAEALPNLQFLQICSDASVNQDVVFSEVEHSNLRCIVFNSADHEIDVEPDRYMEESKLSELMTAIESLEFVIYGVKLLPAEPARQSMGQYTRAIIDTNNIQYMPDELHAEQQITCLMFSNVYEHEILVFVDKLNLEFKHKIKELQLHLNVNFSSNKLTMLVQKLPSLCVVRMHGENLPAGELEKAEFLELVRARNIRCFVKHEINMYCKPIMPNLMRLPNQDAAHGQDLPINFVPLPDSTTARTKKKYSQNFDLNLDQHQDVHMQSKKVFYAHEAQYDPQTRKYREDVFSPLINLSKLLTEQEEKIELDSVVTSVQECALPPACDLSLNTGYRSELKFNEFFGTTRALISQEWTQLPSLNAHEQLQSISVLDSNKNPVPFKLGYCVVGNLFYIKLDNISVHETDVREQTTLVSSLVVTVNFKIYVLPVFELLIEDEQMQGLINHLKQFDLNNLSQISLPDFYNRPVRDLLCALYEIKAGACFERSVLFANIGIENDLFSVDNVRIITNTTHAFCEVRINDAWYQIDLGGSPAQIMEYNPEETAVPQPKTFDVNNRTLPNSTLIQCTGSVVEAYALGLLQNYCSIFTTSCYVHNMKDIADKNSNYDFKSFICKAKGSTLPAVLIINLQNFSAEDIVKINSILDPKPSVCNMELPDNVKIIGLYDAGSNASGNDEAFYSRFKTVCLPDPNVAPYSSRIESLSHQSLTDIPDSIKENSVVVDCYEATYWRGIFGQWGMVDNRLTFVDGELLQRLQVKNASRKGKRLRPESKFNIIINNPSFSEDFRLFWIKASITKQLVVNNQILIGFKDIYTAKLNNLYLSESIITWATATSLDKDQYYILNSATFEEFFKSYIFEEGNLKAYPGLIASNPNLELLVHLTHNISEIKWSKLLDECNKYNVRLRVIPPVEISLPEGFKPCTVEYLPNNSSEHRYCIDSSVEPTKINTLAFDVSEHSVEKLIAKVDYRMEQGDYKFDFVESDLLQRLAQGQTVVLYGDLSEQFAEKFASMLTGADPFLQLNGKVCRFKGRLYCMPSADSIQYFAFAPKLSIAECDFIEQSELELPNSQIVLQDETDSTQDQMAVRANNLKQVLTHNPMAYITGKTGVGKSTFINSQFSSHVSCKVFNEMEQILSWAACDATADEQYLILFIDEANMLGINFSVFESMFLPDRNIIVDGKIYNLSDKHVVVIAGNAHSYGGDRILPTIVNNHPSIEINFAPLSVNSMQVIINDTLNTLGIAAHHSSYQEIYELFTKLYSYVRDLDEEKVYITAREIKLGLHLIYLQYPTSFVLNLLCIQVLPEKQRETVMELINFNSDTEAEVMQDIIESKRIVLADSQYLVTESRKPAVIALYALLSLRHKSMLRNEGMPMAGVVLEGPPANGKSDLIRFVLKSLNYARVVDADTPLDSKDDVISYFSSLEITSKNYIVCNASASLEVRKEILLNAYRVGLIVIFDELNSALKGLERLLNDLLMHQYQGVKAEKPGFILIGSQNHISLAGRSTISEALQRRLVFVNVSQYAKDELMLILKHKHANLDPKQVEKSVENFISKPITYLYSGLQVRRTLRDLERDLTDVVPAHVEETDVWDDFKFEPLPL